MDASTQNANIATAIVGGAQASRMRILLVDDHTIMRDALKALLKTDPGIEIVGEAATFAEGLDAANKLKPTVAVIDIRLPDQSGIALAAELKARGSPIRVLILTEHATEDYVRAALRAGALGYVLKRASFADLTRGLRAVSSGQMFVCVSEPFKTQILLHATTQDAAEASGQSCVTRRERQVLMGVALGFANEDIAHSLHISAKTVEKHRGNLMRKLDLHGAADLARYATHAGLIGV